MGNALGAVQAVLSAVQAAASQPSDPLQAAEAYRDRAREHAKRRSDCFERSQLAYKTGQKALAKKLSDEGKSHGNEMRKNNEIACETIFRVRNAGIDQDTIDVHFLTVKEALAKVEEKIVDSKLKKRDHVVVISGWGRHSPQHMARLKPAIIEMMRQHRISCIPDRPNKGCVFIMLQPSTGLEAALEAFMRWLDRDNSCAIM